MPYPTAIDGTHFNGNFVRAVACGNDHAVAVTLEGESFVWGRDQGYRLFEKEDDLPEETSRTLHEIPQSTPRQLEGIAK